MAKEQRPHDLGAEPRLTVKSSVNASEKQLEKASQKAKRSLRTFLHWKTLRSLSN